MGQSPDGLDIRLQSEEDEIMDNPCRSLTEAIYALRRELGVQRERLCALLQRMERLEETMRDRDGQTGGGRDMALAQALTRAIDDFTGSLARLQSALAPSELGKANPAPDLRKIRVTVGRVWQKRQKPMPRLVTARLQSGDTPAVLETDAAHALRAASASIKAVADAACSAVARAEAQTAGDGLVSEPENLSAHDSACCPPGRLRAGALRLRGVSASNG